MQNFFIIKHTDPVSVAGKGLQAAQKKRDPVERLFYLSNLKKQLENNTAVLAELHFYYNATEFALAATLLATPFLGFMAPVIGLSSVVTWPVLEVISDNQFKKFSNRTKIALDHIETALSETVELSEIVEIEKSPSCTKALEAFPRLKEKFKQANRPSPAETVSTKKRGLKIMKPLVYTNIPDKPNSSNSGFSFRR